MVIIHNGQTRYFGRILSQACGVRCCNIKYTEPYIFESAQKSYSSQVLFSIKILF